MMPTRYPHLKSLSEYSKSEIVTEILNYIMERLEKFNGDSIMISVKYAGGEITRRLNIIGSSKIYEMIEEVLEGQIPDLPFTSKLLVNRSYILTKTRSATADL